MNTQELENLAVHLERVTACSRRSHGFTYDEEIAMLRDTCRRIENQSSHFTAYATALDGLMTPEQQAAIPGSGIDGARDARNIRNVVAHLLRSAAPSNIAVSQPGT